VRRNLGIKENAHRIRSIAEILKGRLLWLKSERALRRLRTPPARLTQHEERIHNDPMRTISINVSEKAYLEFKSFGEMRGRPVAELIREAMDLYTPEKIRPARVLREMPTTGKPRLRRRWTKEEIQEEMLG